MATRNLTRKFVEVRSNSKVMSPIGGLGRVEKVEEASDSGLLPGAENSTNWKVLKDSLPPAWLSNIEQIEDHIEKIQEKVTALKILHTKRLKVTFNDDEVKQEQEIDLMTREITVHFKQSEGLLTKFGKQGDEDVITQTERTVRYNIQRSIAKKLQNLSMSFRSSQKEYLGKLQSQKAGSGEKSFEFLDDQKKLNNVTQIDNGFGMAEMRVLEDTEIMVDERDQEIQRIAKSIEELAQIFKELAVLVIDQGTILDRIDYNMDHAVENAKEGIKQLEKAEEHQKSAMSFRCILVMVVLIAVLLLILILKHTSFKKK